MPQINCFPNWLFLGSCFSLLLQGQVNAARWEKEEGAFKAHLLIVEDSIFLNQKLSVELFCECPNTHSIDLNALKKNLTGDINLLQPKFSSVEMFFKQVDEGGNSKYFIDFHLLFTSTKPTLVSLLTLSFISNSEPYSLKEISTPAFIINVLEPKEDFFLPPDNLVELEPKLALMLDEENKQATFGLKAMEASRIEIEQRLKASQLPWKLLALSLVLALSYFLLLKIRSYWPFFMQTSQKHAQHSLLLDKLKIIQEKQRRNEKAETLYFETLQLFFEALASEKKTSADSPIYSKEDIEKLVEAQTKPELLSLLKEGFHLKYSGDRLTDHQYLEKTQLLLLFLSEYLKNAVESLDTNH